MEPVHWQPWVLPVELSWEWGKLRIICTQGCAKPANYESSLLISSNAFHRVTSTRDDDESSISSKSHSSSVLMEDAMPASSKSALPPQHYTPGELDQAIENGNWEAVAASAAAIVNQGVSKSMSSDSERGVV